MNELTLAKRSDTGQFAPGMQLVFGYRAFSRGWWRQVWRRVTWWRQARHVVVDIDPAAGSITTAPMRWSWLRWRWVRA